MPEQSDLNTLEREVEEARDRFATHLALLRKPEMLTAAKNELLTQANEYKDEAIDRARQTVTAKGRSLLEEIRLRVENNPMAALVLGAGLAWKLIRHPPIGGALILAGLASLVNTRPSQTGSRTPTTDAILSARDVAIENAKRTSVSVQELSRQIGSQVKESAERVSSQATALASEARAQIAGATVDPKGQVSAAAARASDYAAKAVDYAGRAADYAEKQRRLARRQYQANPLLMGGAALVCGLVLGVTTRRRTTVRR